MTVFTTGLTAKHRVSVTAVDASDPASPTTTNTNLPNGAVISTSREMIDFDVHFHLASGTGNVQVTPKFWNSRQSLWFSGSPTTVSLTTGTDVYQTVRVDLQGRSCYLSITALTGTTPQVDVDATGL